MWNSGIMVTLLHLIFVSPTGGDSEQFRSMMLLSNCPNSPF